MRRWHEQEAKAVDEVVEGKGRRRRRRQPTSPDPPWPPPPLPDPWRGGRWVRLLRKRSPEGCQIHRIHGVVGPRPLSRRSPMGGLIHQGERPRERR